MRLTADNVNAVAMDCLFRDDEVNGAELPDGAVIVDGIISRYGFHPDRLTSHRDDIASMLADLDDSFRSDGGGGMSFLNAYMTRDGVHWGEHPTMGMLFALGMAVGMVSYPLPREMWAVLPGGMPYLVIDADKLPAPATP